MKKQWCLLISLWQTQNLFPLFTDTNSEIIYTAIPKAMMCSYWTENSHNTVDFSHKYLQMYFAVYVWAKPVARISQQGSQKPQGCHILKIPYWMWQTWNVWAQIFNGGRAPLAPLWRRPWFEQQNTFYFWSVPAHDLTLGIKETC